MKKDIKISYLKKAVKFLKKNGSAITEEEVDKLVIKFVKKRVFGIDTNVDFKQMSGAISDVYRIRKGNIRIIVRLKDEEIIIEAVIVDIGYRGDIYK